MNLNKGRFTKGHRPWNKDVKGLHFSPSTEFKKGQVSDEKHPGWKGDKVSYMGIHKWISRHFQRPEICEFCGIKGVLFHWANISKEYKRERSDWFNLCVKCHGRYDNRYEKMWKTRRAKA